MEWITDIHFKELGYDSAIDHDRHKLISIETQDRNQPKEVIK